MRACIEEASHMARWYSECVEQSRPRLWKSVRKWRTTADVFDSRWWHGDLGDRSERTVCCYTEEGV